MTHFLRAGLYALTSLREPADCCLAVRHLAGVLSKGCGFGPAEHQAHDLNPACEDTAFYQLLDMLYRGR